MFPLSDEQLFPLSLLHFQSPGLYFPALRSMITLYECGVIIPASCVMKHRLKWLDVVVGTFGSQHWRASSFSRRRHGRTGISICSSLTESLWKVRQREACNNHPSSMSAVQTCGQKICNYNTKRRNVLEAIGFLILSRNLISKWLLWHLSYFITASEP